MESTSCSKETILVGYKSPLYSNSVFVIMFNGISFNLFLEFKLTKILCKELFV